MSPIPVLFSNGKLFPQQVLFGLIYNGYVHPIRVVADDKVRPLFDSKPEPIPDNLQLWAVGDDCLHVLEKAGLLEGLFMAMAQDMVQAIRSQIPRKTYTDTPQGRAAARKATMKKLGLPHGTD